MGGDPVFLTKLFAPYLFGTTQWWVTKGILALGHFFTSLRRFILEFRLCIPSHPPRVGPKDLPRARGLHLEDALVHLLIRSLRSERQGAGDCSPRRSRCYANDRPTALVAAMAQA